MKSVIPTVILVLVLVTSTQSAVFLERQPLILGHEGKCYDREENIFYKAGQEMKWTGDECGRKICAGSFGIEIQTCGKIAVPPECHVKSDPTLPYPKCCGWITCPRTISFTEDSDNEVD
ncbi:hypothetical protein RUM43_013999 [Polyplax serrata]|uniref:Single domain-containing protein n=1 Tax=Polyplax serrata TaxID=468196 RepID=A0AAN8P533_POLSC